MDKKALRNLDLDPSYYGLNKSTQAVLDNYYPTFILDMTPADFIYTDGDTVEVNIKLSMFRVGGRVINPEHIFINGVELEGTEFTESISSSKQYDIEVVYKGKTTIRTRTICIIYPVYCLFSQATGELIEGFRTLPDLAGALKVKAIDSSVHKVTLDNVRESQYFWVATPSSSTNLLSILPIGLLETLSIDKVVDNGEFVYWRSKDLLNKGTWKFALKIEADISFDYDQFNCYTSIDLEYKESVQVTRLQVPLEDRYEGAIISYVLNGSQVVEKYITTDFTDEEWKKNDNWTLLTDEVLTEGLVFETADGEIFNSVR